MRIAPKRLDWLVLACWLPISVAGYFLIELAFSKVDTLWLQAPLAVGACLFLLLAALLVKVTVNRLAGDAEPSDQEVYVLRLLEAWSESIRQDEEEDGPENCIAVLPFDEGTQKLIARMVSDEEREPRMAGAEEELDALRAYSRIGGIRKAGSGSGRGLFRAGQAADSLAESIFDRKLPKCLT